MLAILLLVSCEADDDTGAPPVIANEAPTVPKLVFPINNEACTNFNLEFDWDSATDNDQDEIRYIIDVAENDRFSTILFTESTSQTVNTFTLSKGTTYFWRVKAIDSQGNESAYAPVESFFTEPEAGVNTIPNTPTIVSPLLGERLSATTITLDWDATDADNDLLTYDVYFGETNPPVLLSQNVDVTTFDVSVLPDKTYYWRIVVKDNHQGTAIGQLWRFKSE